MIAEAALARPLTYDDLAALPDDGKRYELINGELCELTGPTPKHQWSSSRLFTRLDAFVNQRQLGQVFYAPIDVCFTPHNVVQPDIVYVSRERRGIIRSQRIEGVPDLLMEILSPSNRAHDVVKKAATYATFGVPEYWLVDPEEETIVPQNLVLGLYVPIHSIDGLARSIVLWGFEVDPVEIFAMPTWMQNEG
jgi:Uma2 family endonuclease